MSYLTRLATLAHILLAIHHSENKEKVTSTFLANSTQTNPVIVRNLLGKLQEAGFVKAETGIDEAYLTKQPEDLILWDTSLVVEDSNKTTFKPHDNTNPNCEVGHVVHSVLDPRLNEIHNQFLQSLKTISLAFLITDMDNKTAQNNH